MPACCDNPVADTMCCGYGSPVQLWLTAGEECVFLPLLFNSFKNNYVALNVPPQDFRSSPGTALKMEGRFTDQNHCMFESRCWPNRRQQKISAQDCNCQNEQEYFSATVTFMLVFCMYYSVSSTVFGWRMPRCASMVVVTLGRRAAHGTL